MRTKKKFLVCVGVLIFLTLVTLTPAVNAKITYQVLWKKEYTDSLTVTRVDKQNNLYFSYWTQEDEYRLVQMSTEGIKNYDKKLDITSPIIGYRIDENGKYFFVDIVETPLVESALGRIFSISVYTNEFIFDKKMVFNLTEYFEGNFVANFYHADEDSAYFAIWQYQTDYTVLDAIQLAKFNSEGILAWNKTIEYNPLNTIFGFEKNSLGKVYVENEGILYYLDDSNGSVIWQVPIELEDPGILEFSDNILLISFKTSTELVFEVYSTTGIKLWSIIFNSQNPLSIVNRISADINEDYIGIVYQEIEFDVEKSSLKSLFQCKILNETGGVLYEEVLEIEDSAETTIDKRRYLSIFPTTTGKFYRHESLRNYVDDTYENSISFCELLTRPISGFTFVLVITSIGIIGLIDIKRKK